VPEKKEHIDFVEPEEEELEEEEHYRIEVLPNVFTPNNDGNNDRLTINSKGLNNFNITVINMQNKVVYKSNDVSFKWDGLDLNNKPAPSGRYVYYITAQDKEGNPINKYSQLTLIR
jgi:gliding motility-associated-like protein